MTQPMVYDLPCAVGGCNKMARAGGFLCQSHWSRVPETLKVRLVSAHQGAKQAKSDAAAQAAARAYTVARNACVEAASQ